MKRARLLPLAASLLLLFSSSEEKLHEINLKIQEVQAKLQASRQDKSSILNDIYALELQAESVVIELRKNELLLGGTQAKISRLKKEEAAQLGRIQRSQQNMRRVLRVLYKMGELGYVKLFLNIGGVDQLFRNYRLIVSLMDDRMAEIRQIRQGIARLQRLQAELRAELERLGGLRREAGAKLARLHGLKREKLDMIARINRQRDLNSRLLEELRAEGENLTRFLGQKSGAGAADVADLAPLRGQLTWPLRGSVISSFGRKKSAKFNTYTINNGIEIKPEAADEIRAVASGEVIFCDYFKGYGNLVILQHANGFYTLYGHCESFRCRTGERVGGGAVIAVAGASGSLFGKSLYFEIRQGLKPLDPLLWLAGK